MRRKLGTNERSKFLNLRTKHSRVMKIKIPDCQNSEGHITKLF